MMSARFNPKRGLIIVRARVYGPETEGVVRLAVATGVTTTILNMGILQTLGCDPSMSEERLEVITGSGMEYVPKVWLDGFLALGQYRETFPVLGHYLPPSARVDGLLGLDFFEGQVLHIDFKKGEIELRP